jgi:Flp pilus assembly protein TadD
MKRLLIVAFAALLTLSPWVRAEGPDDKYIEIYQLIQEGNQLAARGQADTARQRYTDAQTELKKLQASYPNWNEKLVEFRLRHLQEKLAPPPAKLVAPTEATPGPNEKEKPAGSKPAKPASAPSVPLTKSQAEVDDRDNQIKSLQEQTARLQNDNNVLEAKLREALAAQPAAIDPRELARSEERIKALEKEKEVLNVSVRVAESKAAQTNQAGAGELKKALAEARQKLAEQNDVVMALRQERDVLQQRVQATKPGDDETLRSLRADNENLKKQMAERALAAAPEPARGSPDANELTSTKAALQSSRETVASLQVRMRTLQEERDRLEKTRRDLETRLASAAPAASTAADSNQVRRLQKERDELQKKLTETTRELADAKGKTKQTTSRSQPSEDVSALRARLEALEARKVPYTPEELALFKKPQEPAVLTAAPPEKASKELPPSATPLLADAQRALAARRFDEAEKKLTEVLRLDDKNVETLQRLAAAQLEQSRPKDAEANLKKALEQRPSDARSLLLMGIAEFDQDKFDDALNYLSRSAQSDAQNPETQNYLGITLSQKGQRAAAETALRKAIQLSPSYSSAHYNLAVIYATQTPPFTELARWHYQKALAYGHPQSTDVEKMLDKKQTASQK